MTVERWRMASGRVAVIDLSGHPDAVEGARELLAMNGATRIVDREPVQAFAADEYDEARAAMGCVSNATLPKDALGAGGNQPEGEISTTTQQEAGMTMSSIDHTPQKRETLRPIYGPNDPRWHELAAWMLDNRDSLIDNGRLMASLNGDAEALTPSERGYWHARYVQGVSFAELNERDFEYPQFPDDVEAPAWFEGAGPENGGIGVEDECPHICWDRVVFDDGTIRVDMWQEDVYLPDTREITKGTVELRVWIAGEPVEVPHDLATVVGLLGIAAGLTAAARAVVSL